MTVTGHCACGAVIFEADAIRPTPVFCHCSQCRRTSGHYWAASRAALSDFRLTRQDGLKWYDSSDFARRGFCTHCGSSLFYQVNDADHIGIAAGSLDQPSGLAGGRHIFTRFKGGYYDIADGLPQVED